MSESQSKTPSWPSERPVSAASLLQQSFMRLQEAELLRQRRQFDQAQVICKFVVQRYPNYVAALHTLGLIYRDQNRNEHALDCLLRALMLNPRDNAISTALAEIYLRLGANEMAAQTLKQAKTINPLDATALLMLGDIYQEDCEYDLASETYREALAIKPDFVPAAIGLGWCCGYLGKYAEAAKIFQELIERGVGALEPIRGLSVLPAAVVNIDLLAQLEKIAKEPRENEADFGSSVEFLRALFLDRSGRHAEAWMCLTRANRMMFHNMEDRVNQISERWRTSINMLRTNPGKPGRHDCAGQAISLFILGPSRSGKTTMEQLVGKLSGLKRGYESPCVRDAVLRTFQKCGLPGSNLLELLPPQFYPLCRECYLDELERRAGSAKVFTVTSHGYVHNAALMIEVFQNVRFIFVKRNLEDNVFRIYMTRYRNANEYAYDLKAARDHVLCYHQMMDLMASKFPDIVRVINYEDMVLNPAGAVAVAAELCGLPTSDEPLPAIDTDCGCAVPYRRLMAAALES